MGDVKDGFGESDFPGFGESDFALFFFDLLRVAVVVRVDVCAGVEVVVVEGSAFIPMMT